MCLHTAQRLVCNVVNEEIANDFVRDWREEMYSKSQIVRDLHENAFRSFLKCPNHAHAFCECPQVRKTHFDFFAVDDLLRCPGNGNAGTRRRHHDYIAIRAALQITNVAIMWQNL